MIEIDSGPRGKSPTEKDIQTLENKHTMNFTYRSVYPLQWWPCNGRVRILENDYLRHE